MTKVPTVTRKSDTQKPKKPVRTLDPIRKSPVCEHGRRKAICKACRGSAICEHGRLKAQCKACGGSAICEHGRRKAQCKACGGRSLCDHGRQKSKCKLCKLCKHKIKAMDCAACHKVKKDKIENSERKVGQYGSEEYTAMLKNGRELNNVVATKAHEESAFGFHAAGIRADYYIGNLLKNNLGSPPRIIDYAIAYSLQEAKAVGEDYYFS